MSLHLDREIDHRLDDSPKSTGVVAPAPMKNSALEARLLSPVKSTFSTVGRILTTGIAVSILSLAVVGTAEHFAPMAWRPSTLLGAFGGREDSAKILASLDAARAMHAMQQQEAQRALQETAVVQANNQRISEAYSSLYQRGNMYAQSWANSAQNALQATLNLRMASLEGMATVSGKKHELGFWADGLDFLLEASGNRSLGLGDQLRSSARRDREAAEAELMAGFQRQSAIVATSLRDWAQGLPDPAQVVAFQNKIGQSVPAAREAVPPALLPTVPVAAMKPL